MKLVKNETQLVCIAKFFAVKGEEIQLIDQLHNLIKHSTQEGGCIRYELNQSIDNPEEITFLETWYDKETFDAHCVKSYFTDFFKDGKPTNVERFDVTLHKQILPSTL